MDSDLHHHHHLHLHNHQQQQLNTMNSINNNSSSAGLTRYRSAPSSYFADLMSSTGIYGDDDNDPFFSSAAAVRVSNNQQQSDDFLNQIGGGYDDHQSQFIDSSSSSAAAVKQEQEVIYSESPQQQQHFIYQNQFQSETTTDHSIHHQQQQQQTQPPSSTAGHSAINIPGNLLRQSSSPAGFLAQLDMDNGYSVMRSMDDYRAGARGNVSNPMLSSTKRMKKEIGFPSGSLSSSGTLPRINEGKVMEMKSARDDGGFGSHSWDDSDILSDSFLKELGVESDQNKLSSLMSPSENQNDVGRIRAPTTLIHHLSLPASTAELDKLLQFQDSVPLRSRAKRGCATHPRSIAERVRRTRISERMRKLQDLVPNMDKQTNTADMLDLAVDYIKELQKEAEKLTDHHAKCTCPHKQKL